MKNKIMLLITVLALLFCFGCNETKTEEGNVVEVSHGADIDSADLKHAPNIISIAAIVVIITRFTQPVLTISLRVSFPNLYNILNSHNQSFGICFFTFDLKFLFICTCLNVSYNFALIQSNNSFPKIVNHCIIVC